MNKDALIIFLLILLLIVVLGTGFIFYKIYSNQISGNIASTPKDNTGESQNSAENIISSPKKGDVFVLGTSIKIKWDTSKINAYHIDFIPGEGNNDAPPYISVYGWNPQPPLQGEFIFTYMNLQGGFIPGSYKIKLQSQDKSTTFYSDEFTIASPVPMVPKSDKMFYIETLLNDRSPSQQYAQDDTLYITVDTREGDGSYATPEKGFTLAVGIFDVDENGRMTYGRSLGVIAPEDNMYYDEVQHLWKVGAGPLTSLECNRWHVLRTELTCSSFDINSYCVQRYRYYPGKVVSGANNIDRYFNFYVACK